MSGETTYKNKISTHYHIIKMSKVTNIFHIAGNYIAEQHIDIHDNPNSTIYTVSPDAPTEEQTPATNTPSSIPPDFFCVSARYPEENLRERLAAELSQATSKRDYCRALYRLQHIGCINIDQYASDAQRAEVINRFQSKYTLSASDFCKARMS